MSTQTPYLQQIPVETTLPSSVKSANAALGIPRFCFDRRDHELIRIINDVGDRERDLDYIRRKYYRYFHPHGIKEMAESRSLRIGYAMLHLLTSLETGGMDDRLSALRSLRAEVLETAEGPLPKNTARVLLQIMKELIRARGNPRQQLELAHDFRITSTGKPRQVRRQLSKYHLLEMPEEWNQITFDDHVHDANTKGRKSSTHMIMDAWIKGIRRLRVVHYNYIDSASAIELAEAARIMEIDIRIGIEFYSRFRGQYINLIWVPRGFPDTEAFLEFLDEPAVAELMRGGRRVSDYQQNYVMLLLEAFNQRQRQDLNRTLDINIEPLSPQEFLSFVSVGQKSILHLEKFLQHKILAALKNKAGGLRQEYARAGANDQKRITEWFEQMNRLDLEATVSRYLDPARNPDIPNHMKPQDGPKVPELLKLSPALLLSLLASLQSGYRITLNLTNLTVEDVLELIYDCNGMISRLELFNLKDWTSGNTAHLPDIIRLQEAINSHNPIKLKQVIQGIIQRAEATYGPKDVERLAKLKVILHNIHTLQAMYRIKPLKARIGSDSTGRSPRFHGMGLAVIDTLPRRVRLQIKENSVSGRECIPIYMTVQRRHTFIRHNTVNNRTDRRKRLGQRVTPFLWWWRRVEKTDWAVQSEATVMAQQGNVITLGGVDRTINNNLCLEGDGFNNCQGKTSWRYINSHLRNLLKVIIGFIPAFTTFYLTKDWWLLAYGGAFIWFGITGLRNVLQSVLGGGGLRRSPLLRWNAYVSWDRIADSLLFTGFSVPLLDYLTKTLVLEHMFEVTIATRPLVLYTVMALVNGLYLSAHNAFRGLPKGAVYGNFFRSALSIPIAVIINTAAGFLLTSAGVAAAADILQKWAAIISKAASDMMAGIIEGAADRYNNIRVRHRDYKMKLTELIDIYTHLELLFPEKSTIEILEDSKNLQQKTNKQVQDLERIISIHALDLLYFWMYQPRARSAFEYLLNNINDEEQHLLITSQFTLLQQRDISQMFIDGILGDDFARALSFYLARYPEYLEALKRYA